MYILSFTTAIINALEAIYCHFRAFLRCFLQKTYWFIFDYGYRGITVDSDPITAMLLSVLTPSHNYRGVALDSDPITTCYQCWPHPMTTAVLPWTQTPSPRVISVDPIPWLPRCYPGLRPHPHVLSVLTPFPWLSRYFLYSNPNTADIPQNPWYYRKYRPHADSTAFCKYETR